MRYKFSGTFRDGSGNCVADGTVTVYGSGGSVASSIYETETGTTVVNSTTTGDDGTFEFYILEGDYYGDHTRKIVLSKDGYTSKTYDYVRPTEFVNGGFTQANIDASLTGLGTSTKATLCLRPGTWVIASNADWSTYTNVTFKIVPGAQLSGAFTVTFPANANPEAGDYQIFASNLTVASLVEANILWFGANGALATGQTAAITANTAAINKAILSSASTYFPVGTYYINSALNCTVRGNAGNSVLSMRGSKAYGVSRILWEGTSTGTMIDAVGSRFFRMSNLYLQTVVGYPAGAGIVGSRYGATGANNSDEWVLDDVHVWGYFTYAAVYTLTVEGFNVQNSTFQNATASGYTIARFKAKQVGITPESSQTMTAYNGNTIGWIDNSQIHHGGAGTPIWLDGTEGFGIHSSFISSDGGTTHIKLTGNTHNLDIQNVNAEGTLSATHFLHFADAASVNQDIKLSNLKIISDSTSYANAAIYAETGSTITGLTVEHILGTLVAAGDWYLMSVDGLYGSTIKDAGDTVQIRGAKNGNLIFNNPTTFPLMRYTGDIEATGDLRPGRYYWYDDFDDEAATVQLESSLNADFWVTAGTNYAAANVTYLGLTGGYLKAMCANADNDSVTIYGVSNVRSDLNPIIEARIKIDTKETAGFYVGFSSAAFADLNGAFPNDAFLVGINSDNGHTFGATRIVAASVNNGAAVVYDDMGVSIVSNTYIKIKIDLNDLNQPRVWIDDVEVAAASITGTVATQKGLSPYIMVQNLAGGAIQRFVTVDYIKIWMDRL